MEKLRFKIKRTEEGYVDIDVSREELDVLFKGRSAFAHDENWSAVMKNVYERAYKKAIVHDNVVWTAPEKTAICGHPITVYDFTDPIVIGERIEDAGGGCEYLVYKIRVLEKGMPSIIYGFYVPDVNVVSYQRVSILDSIHVYYSGMEEWCVLDEELSTSPEFAKITEELRTRSIEYDSKKYFPVYESWTNPYNPEDIFENETGDLFTYIFKVVRMGTTTWYGCPVTRKNWQVTDKVVKAGNALFKREISPLSVPDETSRPMTASGETAFCNPKVISEEIEPTGGGVEYLVYQIEAEEEGKRSVLYATFNCYEHEFCFRRASFLDPYETEGNEEWCDVSNIDKDPQFFEILAELKQRSLLHHIGLYERKYAERKRAVQPDGIVYSMVTAQPYKAVFPVIIKGETVWYGYRLDETTGEVDFDHVERLGAKVICPYTPDIK